MSSSRVVRVGLIGLGEVAQVLHLPVLSLMPHLFETTIVCDLSATLAAHCAKKFHIAQHTTNPSEVWSSDNVDVVFVLTADEYHESYTVASLQAGKRVLCEKPMTLSLPSAQRIIDADRAAGGGKVFVGYMRRYAASFTQAFKREVASIPKILYARSRDFSGPNPVFVAQSSAFPVKPPGSDFTPESAKDREQRANQLVQEAWQGREVTSERYKFCRYLNTLGSHDISLMREALGSPASVRGVSANDPFYSAVLEYPQQPDGSPGSFAVTYETGVDGVPVFDAHLAVYGERKRVTIEYDSPFVKGLAIKVKVDEVNEAGETQSREMLSSYEDAFTLELQELWGWVVEGKSIKTGADDAAKDLEIFDMLYRSWDGHVAS